MLRIQISTCARSAVAAYVLLLCALSPERATAQQQARERSAARPSATSEGKPGVITVGVARFEIPDLEVLDQDGRKVRFYSDLIKGKVVVVSVFFTDCSFLCPMQGRALAELQAGLAGRLGKDVFFVSISRDPKTDSPERLKRWGAGFGVGHGWTLVTGTEDVMQKLVADFTGDRLGPRTHEAILLIGNDRTGFWTEAGGFFTTAELVATIDRVAGSVGTER